jgi:hypothetical protein
LIALACPHCGDSRQVVRFGFNCCSGTARCHCLSRTKAFTLSPKSRAVTPATEVAIERALAERVS